MYSSASEKSDEKGRGVGGAILDEIVDADLDRLENLNLQNNQIQSVSGDFFR